MVAFVGHPGAAMLCPAFVTCGFPTGQWEGLCLSLPVLRVNIVTSGIRLLLSNALITSTCSFLSLVLHVPSLVFLLFPKDGYFPFMISKCPAEGGDPVPFPLSLCHCCHWALSLPLIFKQLLSAKEFLEEKLSAPWGQGSWQRFPVSKVFFCLRYSAHSRALTPPWICYPWRKLRESSRRKLRFGRSATLPGNG